MNPTPQLAPGSVADALHLPLRNDEAEVMAFAIRSPAFGEGGTVPMQFTCDGNTAPPPIKVSDPPKGTLPVAGETRQDLEGALEERTLASAELMGRYER